MTDLSDLSELYSYAWELRRYAEDGEQEGLAAFVSLLRQGKPMPATDMAYLADFLEGKVKGKRGPKPKQSKMWSRLKANPVRYLQDEILSTAERLFPRINYQMKLNGEWPHREPAMRRALEISIAERLESIENGDLEGEDPETVAIYADFVRQATADPDALFERLVKKIQA